jgi:CO/xanthine dehydrogenase Mo-binding subunit
MALRRALAEIDDEAIKPLPGTYQDGKYHGIHGIGIGWFVKNTGQDPYGAACVVVSGADTIALYLGITSLDQGHETTMAQICADSLGVPIEGISISHGSTDLMPDGVGTFSSRGTVMAGNAIHLACQKLRDKMLVIPGRYLNIDAAHLEFRHGHIYRQDAADKSLLGVDDLV